MVFVAFFPPIAVADLSGAIVCDQYIRTVGGPCMEGVPSGAAANPGVLPQAHRDVMGFILGKDSFAEARKVFGRAREWHSGDAAAAETKVCYVSHDKEGTVTLVLAQNAEMSRRIDEIRLIRGEIGSSGQCALVDTPPARLKSRSGLHAGMSRLEVLKILGKPTFESEGFLFYEWHKDRKLSPGQPGYSSCLVDGVSIATLGSGITLRIEDGSVVWLTIAYSGGYLC